MQRVSSGIEGLDIVLGGGFLPESIILVEGTPGTGKTTLGLQFIYSGIVEAGEPGIIITFEQLPNQLYRDAATFGWDLARLEEEGKLRVVCTSPQTLAEDLRTAGGLLDSLVMEMAPRRIMIDSITVMEQIMESPREYRDIFYSLCNDLKMKGLTAIIVRELQENLQAGGAMEEFLSDVVIRLSYEETITHTRSRYLYIMKTRGHSHMNGRHALRFGERGLEVFPCPRPPMIAPSHRPTTLEKVPTGVPGLDDMMDYGLLKGMTTLIAGSPGTGKTTMGLQFLNEGAQKGEPGLLVSLEEWPEKLHALARSYRFGIAEMMESGLVTVLHVSPTEVSVEELFTRIIQGLERTQATRLVFDSLSALGPMDANGNALRDFVFALAKVFYTLGVTAIFTSEMPQPFEEPTLSGGGLSVNVDNILLLSHVRARGRLRRAISVLKSRGSPHTEEVREYIITRDGVQVLSTFLEVEEGPAPPAFEEPSLMERHARAFLQEVSFPEAEYEDLVLLLQERVEKVLAGLLRAEDHPSWPKFLEAHRAGRTLLSRFEGPTEAQGEEEPWFLFPSCPFLDALGRDVLEEPHYRELFSRFREKYWQAGEKVPILFPLCVAHFLARQRILSQVRVAERPVEAEQLGIRCGEEWLWAPEALTARGLDPEAVRAFLQRGFCAYRLRLT